MVPNSQIEIPRKFFMKKMSLALLVFTIFLSIWHLLTQVNLVSPLLLPSPIDIGRYLGSALRDGTLLEALGITLIRLFIGYALGLTLGVLLGLYISFSPLGRSTIGIAALGLQTLPSVCWAPLALLWFGQTEMAMYFVVIMGSLWAIAIATENAIRSVPPIYIRAAHVLGSTGIHMLWTIILPAALPQLVNGAKQGWAFAWRSLMAAEIYVTILSHIGIGQLLHFGRELNAMDQAMGIMFVIILAGFLADKAFFLPIETFLRRSRGLSI